MLAQIELRGFKAFSSDEAVQVPLRRLTFLFGPNSSGKSAIFQALLSLKQSWTALGTMDRLATRGHETDAGEFASTIFAGLSESSVAGLPEPGDDDQDSQPSGSEDLDNHLFGDEEGSRRTMTLTLERHERARRSSRLSFTYGQAATRAAFAAASGILEHLEMQHPLLDDTVFHAGTVAFVPTPPQADDMDQVDFAHMVLGQEETERLLQLAAPEGHIRSALRESLTITLHLPKQPDQDLGWSVMFASATFEAALRADREPNDELEAEVAEALAAAQHAADMLMEALTPTTRAQATSESERVCDLLDRAVREVLKEFRRELVDVGHIGGLRERGHWSYPLHSADKPVFAGRHGERVADMLVQSDELVTTAGDLFSYLLPKTRLRFVPVADDGMGEQRARVLFDFTLGSESRSHEDGPYITSSLPSLGTGVSQVFPIVVQLAAALTPGFFQRPPLFLIEQPELHLHPRLQARLARALVDTALGRLSSRTETGWDAASTALRSGPGAQILIETHSEHLILAASNLIRQGALSHTDAIVLVIERDDERGSSRIREVLFDPNGDLVGEWPGGFFEERFHLLEGEDV